MDGVGYVDVILKTLQSNHLALGPLKLLSVFLLKGSRCHYSRYLAALTYNSRIYSDVHSQTYIAENFV